ncbi:unnamed protein product [Kluyveromyces dobzhanskii CBS 2104]|uniref:Peroxisomal ATPase PEX1 n=1 Tax=Kluyveromyces dobzhanskii CBS 2104 TaxID=1427455 RepID=A0A0A8L238_9SACH|nr:unnamed protein product [Kluyveromyces dobzhanskii CBS 2104]
MNGQQLNFQGLRVVFSRELDSNLVRLPNNVCQLLDQSNIPIQEFGITINEEVYAGWDGQASKAFQGSDHILEINAIFAGEYKIQMGQLVDVSVKRFGNETLVSEVHVEPSSFQDWEIIDANAAYFQDQILYQTRLVKQGAKLLCFMQNIVCRFTVTCISPDDIEVGRLTNDTLFIVSPKVKEKPLDSDALKLNGSERIVKRSLLGEELHGLSVALKEPQHAYTLISLIKNPIELIRQKKDDDSAAHEICCKVIQDSSLADDEVKLSEQLRRILQLAPTNGYKIKIVYVKIPDTAFKVIVHPDSENSVDVEQYINSLGELDVITDGLAVPGSQRFSVELQSVKKGAKVPFGLVPGKNLIEIGESRDSHSDAHEELSKPSSLAGIDKLYTEIIDTVKSPLGMSNSFLIQGGSGMGKSLILENLKYDLTRSGYHVNYVNCDSIPDSTNLAKTKQYISELLHISYWHQPSVILLDNADSLFSAIKSSEEQPSSSNIYSQTSTKLAQMMMNDAEQLMHKNSNSVKIVMAAKSLDNLNKLFSQKQFIGEMWTLRPPTRYQRNDILTKLLKEKGIVLDTGLNVADISIETEGYSPADLHLIVDRLFYELLTLSDSLTLTRPLLESSISGFTPASLRSVKLQKSTGVRWSDIGGLTSAKRLLLETFEWPTKYAPIFASSPLRLRSGILLYGYPGCGKTMLASAVAQQCGLNFISVKGPEILNKYIGASEQSVRDLFNRAQAAKPCILFFDEFDSIAPKRGHDSTGVTDRVVNQMLTQMDGAEGLDGVYVLAATSRPDLIDSALLRPGRLDKSVVCDIPDVAEREDILRAVTSKMNVQEKLDFHEVALRTEGFTGADLQGMTYNAYLKAVHRTLENGASASATGTGTGICSGNPHLQYISLGHDDKPVTREAIDKITELLQKNTAITTAATGPPTTQASLQPTISTQDIIDAAQEANPSISQQEMLKLSTIYHKFVGDREGHMPSGEASHKIGGRTTLA